jgi:hypothetical protein
MKVEVGNGMENLIEGNTSFFSDERVMYTFTKMFMILVSVDGWREWESESFLF